MAATIRYLEDTVSGGKSVERVRVNNGGTGYTSAPTVVFTSATAGGTTAVATATISAGGSVTSVDFSGASDTQGSGYLFTPSITFTGGGGSTAAADAEMTYGTKLDGYTDVLISMDDHGAGVTVDASGRSGGYDGTHGFKKYEILSSEWATDVEVNVSFTGTGTTDAINFPAGTTGTFDSRPITNTSTQPGDATNADITVTPATGCDGFVYMKLRKTDFV